MLTQTAGHYVCIIIQYRWITQIYFIFNTEIKLRKDIQSIYPSFYQYACIIYRTYIGKILRTINFAVFEDFTTASKINSLKF